ncbi:MAG: DciA family protein [Pseudomonadota bacterium]
MTKKAERSITEVIKAAPRLQNLLAQCGIINEFNQILQMLIKKYIANANAQVANYNQGILSILVADAALATKLRFYVKELLKDINTFSNLPDVAKIKISVAAKMM